MKIHYSHNQQLSAFYVGLEVLQKSGSIKWRLNLNFSKTGTYPYLYGEFLGSSFYVDCLDGYNWISGSLQENLDYFEASVQADYVFKRNYTAELQKKLPKSKILPFGFSYPVGLRVPITGNWVNQFLRHPYWALKYHHLLRGYFDYRSFESGPSHSKPSKVLYQVRLWDPSSAKDMVSRAQREKMNSFRVGCVRTLQNHFPNYVVVGVEDSPYSRAYCPDLVISTQNTSRNNYFNLIRECPIGVTSNGLHQSIGWKMGEYLAASRAIICERPYFLFPPHFLEGKNYLGFSTPEELVIQVDNLLSKPDKLSAMMQENQNYYQEYQRPDRLVWHILRQMEL